jgi:hypothetical protein
MKTFMGEILPEDSRRNTASDRSNTRRVYHCVSEGMRWRYLTKGSVSTVGQVEVQCQTGRNAEIACQCTRVPHGN